MKWVSQEWKIDADLDQKNGCSQHNCSLLSSGDSTREALVFEQAVSGLNGEP